MKRKSFRRTESVQCRIESKGENRPYGYHARILRVDLSEKEAKVEESREIIYRRYLGGGALASYYC